MFPILFPYLYNLMSSATKSISLYRALLRNARSITDYNFRSYAIRRIKHGFEKNRSLSGEALEAAFKEGESNLAVVQRQSTLSKLYPSARSVMES